MANLPGTEVVNFMRSPAWVYYRVPPSKHLGRDVEDANPAYSEEEIAKFNDPESHKEYRKGIISRTNKAFRLVCWHKKNTNWVLLTYVIHSLSKAKITRQLLSLVLNRWPKS